MKRAIENVRLRRSLRSVLAVALVWDIAWKPSRWNLCLATSPRGMFALVLILGQLVDNRCELSLVKLVESSIWDVHFGISAWESSFASLHWEPSS